MMNQWRLMMDNLSDIYYLVRLIIHQISIYLRDLILYKFFWIATTNEDFDAHDPKVRGLTLRNFTTDIVAFSVICIILFLLIILASNLEKDEGPLYASAGIETTLPHFSITDRVTVNLEEDPFCMSNSSANATNCFHACGDSVCARGGMPKRNFSADDMSRVRSSSKKSNVRIPKKSIFGLNDVQPQSSQSTQTTNKVFQRTTQKWLIRRTRSGHIYGKYPI